MMRVWKLDTLYNDDVETGHCIMKRLWKLDTLYNDEDVETGHTV
jgi:hypothetical protein